MSTTVTTLRSQVRDVVRSRWLIGYLIVLLALTDVLFRFGGGGDRVVLSLINVMLIQVPLVALVFGTMYLYHARDFIVLLLAQPVKRRHLFAGLYLGLALPLAVTVVLGTGLPFVWHGGLGAARALAFLLMTGTLLTLVSVALAFLIATLMDDRAGGLGLAVACWLGAVVLYDGLVLLAVAVFSAYPLEKPLLVLTLLNPVDLGRVVMLLQLDVAALMGYTGATFERFFGSALGLSVGLGALALWCIIPFWLGRMAFGRKDF